MSEQHWQQQPGSVLQIRPGFIPLAFLLYFFKPSYSINGSPAITGQWKQNTVPVPPGRYQVTVWVKYLFAPRMGLSSIVVDVPPGAAAVITWRAPLTIFGTGRIAVAGVESMAGAQPGTQWGGPAQQVPQQAPQTAPGGWHPDPTGRHQVRYFDGSRWTEHVGDSGRQALDPIA